MTQGFTLFETPVGACAIAWGQNGIVGVSLPSGGETPLRANMLTRFPNATESAPPPAVVEAIARVRALLNGESEDLMSITLDMDGIADFNKKVYAVARAIPPGQTLTYG